MRLKNAFKIVTILIIACFSVVSFAEETNKPKDNTDPAAIFEKVLRDHEMKKQQEEATLTAKLNDSLYQAINAWIKSAKEDKDIKIGTFLQQNWEKLSLTFKVSLSHYEYYLRGYKYTVIKSDVMRTGSLTTAYKAEAVIKEELFVEKYHPPNVSDPNLFFYTVSTDYHLNFEYKQDKFVLVSSDSKIVGFINDCPIEIRKSDHRI